MFDNIPHIFQAVDIFRNPFRSEFNLNLVLHNFPYLILRSFPSVDQHHNKMSIVMRGSRMLAQRGARLVQTRGYADEMKLTFAAANQVFYDKSDVRQIDVPTLSGAFGILPKHVPTLAVLQPGVVNVFEKDGNQKKFFVSSGTVTVNNDSSVQVLAEEAHPLENLDASLARECLTKAQQELSSASSDVVSEQFDFLTNTPCRSNH